MTTTTLHAPLATAARGPGFWQRVWSALEAHGQRRAAAELRRLAILNDATNPEFARRLNDVAAQTAAR